MRCVQDVARTQCLAYPINERCATCRISKLRWRHGRGAQSRIRKARGRSLLTVTGLCLSDTVFSGYRSTPCDVVESALPQAERVGEAAAVTGAAIVALDKILNQKDPLHVEKVEFPEEAEQDAAEAEKTAEAYAEAEAKAADDAAEQPTAPAEADAPEAPAEPAPAQEPATLEDTSEEKPVYDPEAPNPNPVEAGPAVAPKDENGKFDPTKIADVSDFGDWEEQGCKG